ncbi:putative ThiF/HesA family dinucleotide-utilizing enzyme [Methanomicrobium sp. W14]|uniref:hypothetical protein n=1 Tax=Methanomicrobium sp. W14 TaxID=2817839 RepID=UPI001AE48772|nr:hypothetical protein [Methanomicrobium sp. W14]MBP2133576.1 putative ThiF/HesA family dinucleotide-utilizing enzyme [Methanomicrobium sp. W14]
MSIEDLEKKKVPFGEVTLVGAGRLGLRTAINLYGVHGGGPERLTLIDGQKISSDDQPFKLLGAKNGDFKVRFIERILGDTGTKKVTGIPENACENNLDFIKGDVVCIEVAGGDTLPLTAEIIRHVKSYGGSTISTMGVGGVGDEEVKVIDISEGSPDNPIITGLQSYGITKNHVMVGTGKLIRDWEPVTPWVLDRVACRISSEILKILNRRK